MAGRRRDINTYQADEHQTEGEEEQDQQRQCLLCGKYPDSIICLSCDHCVDIPCAARIILQSQKFKDIDLSEIQCPACQQVTNLSEEVQATLIEYLQSESVEFDVGNEEQDEEGEEAYRADAGPEGENAGENEGEEEYEEEPEVMKHKSANKSHKSSQQQGSENKLIEKSVGSRGNRRVGSAKHQLSSSKDLSRDRVASIHTSNELSFHFACMDHPNEEYAYYSATTRKLYCAQCLLKDNLASKVRDLKSIKRSLPTIMQHLDELLSNVEVSKGLIENRKKDADIKLEDMKSKLISRKCAGEGMFDELLERVMVCKGQFSESMDNQTQTMLADLKEGSIIFDEKLDYLDAVLDQVNQIQENDYSNEELVGFFFANQDKIKTFIEEENEQKLMNKLRSQCEMIDHKNAKLVETQLERYLKEMQSALTSIFDKSATYAKDKGENRRDSEENTRLNNLSKYMLGSYSNERQNGDFNNQRRSSSKTQMMTAAVSRENFGFVSSTPNGLKTVAMFANERQAGSRTPGTEGKRLMMTGMSGHDRAVAAGLFSNEQKAAINNLEDFQNKIFQKLKGRKLAAPTKKSIYELDEDPMVSINRKLAAFNLRQRSRDLNMPNHGNHTEYRGSDWFSSKAEDFIEPRTEPQYNFIESNKPNVESLRNFRQKMREKYSKEQTGGFRGKLAYSTQ